MKNSNEYQEGGKIFVRNVSSCTCARKAGECYWVTCKIHERGSHEYAYQKGESCISKANGGKKLWLTDTARESVEKAVETLDSRIAEASTDAYRTIVGKEGPFLIRFRLCQGTSYHFLLTYHDGVNGQTITEWYENTDIREFLRELRFKYKLHSPAEGELIRQPTRESIDRHPFILAARESGDEMMEKVVKLYYHLEDAEDCSYLADAFGEEVLPPLPERYNKSFVVDSDSITAQNELLLFRSGFTILHRPYFGMNGSTHQKWQLNPHTKIGVDAAKEESPAITFAEFLRLYEMND